MADAVGKAFLVLAVLLSSFLLPSSCGRIERSSATSFSKGVRAKLKEKVSHLHFYFHDVVSGRNVTAVAVARPPVVMVMDDLLTEGPEPTSRPVGRAQGLYAAAGLQEMGFLQAMNLVFAGGKYDGSVLTVLGRNAPFHAEREMPVVGGSGLFRFARGYAVARTHWLDMSTGNAIVEYDVYVMHY
ncbi:Dirigent-like protein [Musa troglodytarum]|uniref:Dirigent protein n=1 Tax=Musa troglodytarum TaxID=320322 RepID=A0A9E7GIP0_9LILI|nr:Dirigent-like protein [Musa troglodytarum]